MASSFPFRTITPRAITAFAAIAFVVAGCSGGNYAWHGSAYSAPRPAPDFTLAAADGSTFHLGATHPGPVLVYFGYTHCPDECPATMGNVKWMLGQLGMASTRVTVVFISVDPQRDTPQVLSDWLSHFGPQFLGIRAEGQDLKQVEQAYGVFAEVAAPNVSGETLIVHNSRLFFIDTNGVMRTSYDLSVPREEILADLQHGLAS
jgi:protein SCO1